MELETQKTIIANAKKGDQKAFRYLLDSYWAEVYLYLLKKTKNENDAEDIAIQAFSKAFDRIETFDEQYAFKTWLITIANHISIDVWRKERATSHLIASREQEARVLLIADENLSPEDELIHRQNLSKLLKDIKKLKPKYQQVIQLRYFNELSYKEIADHINEPINNVKVKLLRAKKLLAEIIKNRP